MERKMVAARVLELAPLLESKDRTVVRQAVFALGSLNETPPALVVPLLEAGRLTIELIKEAKTQAPRPDDPAADPAADAAKRALQFFDMWHIAVNQAGKVEDPRLRTFLEDVQRETAGSQGDLWTIWKTARDMPAALPAGPAQ